MRPVPRGERTQVMAAIAGIDIALWDLKGKAAGLPVWRLLGGENRPLVDLCDRRLLPAGRAEFGLCRGDGAVSRSRLSRRQAEDRRRHASPKRPSGSARCAPRSATAPDLMLDMNAPYDLPDCIEFARRVEPHRIFWLEEPLHWYLQPADFARLAAATPIPLAHGERELTRFTVRDFIVEGGIRYVQFDATRAAGFTEALRVAALAEQHGVMVAPHTAPEIHGHLVLALPRCAYGVESHGDAARNPLSHHLLIGGPETRDSCVHLNDKARLRNRDRLGVRQALRTPDRAARRYAGTAPPIVVRCIRRRCGRS